MKKLLSIVLAVVLCLGMVSVAFAVSSPSSPDSPKPYIPPISDDEDEEVDDSEVVVAVDADGNKAVVAEKTLDTKDEVYVEVKTAGTTEKFLEEIELKDEVDAIVKSNGLKAEDLKVHSTIDVYVKEGTPTFPLTVQMSIAGVKTTDTVVLIHKAKTGYEVIKAKVVKDNVVEAVFNSLSPVVVLVEKAKYTSYADCTKDDNCFLAPFTDLDASLWYHDGIHYCVEHDMMNGVGNNKFDPAGTTTRAMIVTILWRLQGSPVVYYPMDFTDVLAGTWYTDAVRWAASIGLVNGYPDGTFKPTGAITRQELATIIYRYEQKINNGGFSGEWMFYLDYPDKNEISSWATEAMYWVVMKGIVNGKGGKLVPTGDASRAEAATMIMRYCTLK